MRRERIEEIKEWSGRPWRPTKPGHPSYDEINELANLALRATDPELVMVPREPTELMVECAIDNKVPNTNEYQTFANAYMEMVDAAQENQP